MNHYRTLIINLAEGTLFYFLKAEGPYPMNYYRTLIIINLIEGTVLKLFKGPRLGRRLCEAVPELLAAARHFQSAEQQA